MAVKVTTLLRHNHGRNRQPGEQYVVENAAVIRQLVDRGVVRIIDDNYVEKVVEAPKPKVETKTFEYKAPTADVKKDNKEEKK